jgi:hypothetical protein
MISTFVCFVTSQYRLDTIQLMCICLCVAPNIVCVVIPISLIILSGHLIERGKVAMMRPHEWRAT